MFSQSFVLFTYYSFFLVYPVKLQQLYEVLVVLKSWVLFLLFSQASKTVQIASWGEGGSLCVYTIDVLIHSAFN